MLKTRIKRNASPATLALKRISDIEVSIGRLIDADLLDLADIFAGKHPTPLADMAAAKMDRRKITM